MTTQPSIQQKTFGRWTVVNEDTGRTGYWDCICSCGKAKTVKGSHLREGRSKSCGCSIQDKVIDIAGKVFGRLTVKARISNIGGCTAWECSCECGNTIRIRGSALKSGNTHSCGCLHKEITAEIGYKNKTHGMRHTKTYGCWSHILGRCNNPNDKSYGDYGGRGISICERWLTFENFLEDMGERPLGTSIERNDVNGNYEPGNCRWATRVEQNRNTRRSRTHLFDGKERTLAELCEISGQKNETLRNRLDRGWEIERAMNTPATLYHNRALAC